MAYTYTDDIGSWSKEWDRLTSDEPNRVRKVSVVRYDSKVVGWVRALQSPPRWQWMHKDVPVWTDVTPYREARKSKAVALLKAAGNEKKEGESPDGRTMVKNSCGHEYPYTITKETLIEWLEKRPCPVCKAKGEAPEEAKPEPEPKPKADEKRVQEIFATFPSLPMAAHHRRLPDLLLLLEAKLPVWLQGPPGTSKSTLAQQAAEALGLGFFPISCHEMMTRTDLFGFTDAVGKDHRTPMWDAFENGGVCLLDEVDNGNPNLLAALNSALSNGHCVFGSGTVVEKHDDFRVVATANTAGLGPEHGFVGRLGVDLATRDRFVTVQVPIDDALETAIAYSGSGDIDSLTESVTKQVERSKDTMMVRATNAAVAPNADAVLKAVRDVRKMVEQRFRGSVVSPRTTLHATAMVGKGFTLDEAIEAKLPGLNRDEMEQVLQTVRV